MGSFSRVPAIRIVKIKKHLPEMVRRRRHPNLPVKNVQSVRANWCAALDDSVRLSVVQTIQNASTSKKNRHRNSEHVRCARKEKLSASVHAEDFSTGAVNTPIVNLHCV